MIFFSPHTYICSVLFPFFLLLLVFELESLAFSGFLSRFSPVALELIESLTFTCTYTTV